MDLLSTPERLREKSRCLDAINALICLSEVAGNQSRFLFDFSPESIVFRITSDPAPRVLYCFSETGGKVSAGDLVQKIQAGDVDPQELYVGGKIGADNELKSLNLKCCVTGIKKSFEEVKVVIKRHLELG